MIIGFLSTGRNIVKGVGNPEKRALHFPVQIAIGIVEPRCGHMEWNISEALTSFSPTGPHPTHPRSSRQLWCIVAHWHFRWFQKSPPNDLISDIYDRHTHTHVDSSFLSREKNLFGNPNSCFYLYLKFKRTRKVSRSTKILRIGRCYRLLLKLKKWTARY